MAADIRTRAIAILAITAASSIAAGAMIVPAIAQQAAPVFRSSVDLVRVDVTAVDSQGRPVRGLTADDFTVTLGGQQRPVRAIDYLELKGRENGRVADPPPIAAGGAPSTTNRRAVLLVIDDLSMPAGQMTGLRVAAERMLGSFGADDLVGIATTSGLGPAVSPTTDRAAITAALKHNDLVGRNTDQVVAPYVSAPEALDIDRNVAPSAVRARDKSTIGGTYARVVQRECFDALERKFDTVDESCMEMVIRNAKILARDLVTRSHAQLSAYKLLIESLRSAPGQRVMIALSAGVPLGVESGVGAELAPVSLAAARADVRFFALTDLMAGNNVADTSASRAGARRKEESFLTTGLHTVAEATGGAAFAVVGQADRFFARVMDETSSIYQLGVELPASSRGGDSMAATVTTNRKGVVIRVNAHALMPGAAPPAPTVDEELESHLASGAPAASAEFTWAGVRWRFESSEATQLGVTLSLPPSAQGPFIVRFLLVDQGGRALQAGRRVVAETDLSEGYSPTFDMRLPPESSRLRVAVADRSGRIGLVERPVSATLDAVGRFKTSDLLASWDPGDQTARLLALNDLHAAVKTLNLSLELYPQDELAAENVSVTFVVLSDRLPDPVTDEAAQLIRGKSLLRATADVPVDALEPGTYTIKATVFDSGKPIGSVSKTFNKLR